MSAVRKPPPFQMPWPGRQETPHGARHLGTIPGSYFPAQSHLDSTHPFPRIPVPDRSSLYSASGLTFQKPQQPQQSQQVTDSSNDISAFEVILYITLGLAGGIWIGSNFLYRIIGCILSYAVSLLGYSQPAATTTTTESRIAHKGCQDLVVGTDGGTHMGKAISIIPELPSCPQIQATKTDAERRVRLADIAEDEAENDACARLSHLMVGQNPTKIHNDRVKQFAGEKPENLDSPGLEARAPEPPAPERDCNQNELVALNSTRAAEREEADRLAAEWARFQRFKEWHEVRYWVSARKHYDSLLGGDLDPEEIALRRYEYDQKMWAYFLEEEKCLQEEKEQDARSRMRKERPPIPPMEMPKPGWDRRKMAEKYGISPIRVPDEGETTLEDHLKQRAATRRRAREFRKLSELQRARRLAPDSVLRDYGKAGRIPRFRL